MKKKRTGILGLTALALCLMAVNGTLILIPAEAGTCTANCGGGLTCHCTGKTCSAVDGRGCYGGDDACSCIEQ